MVDLSSTPLTSSVISLFTLYYIHVYCLSI